MSSFSQSAFDKKLSELNSSSQSIQTLSLWLIHHRKHAKHAVKLWKSHLLKATNAQRKLTLMYLANDVTQNGKRKGPEYGRAFADVIVDVFEQAWGSERRGMERRTATSLQRLLSVWSERGVFSKQQIAACRLALEKDSSAVDREATSVKLSPDGVFKQPLSPKSSPFPVASNPAARKRSRSDSSKASPKAESPSRKQRSSEKHGAEIKEVEVEGVKEKHVTLSMHSPSQDPPESSELILALEELETAASSEVNTRQQIADLPSDVCDVSAIDRLVDKLSGEKLLQQVCDAAALLDGYNDRLSGEMQHRKKVAKMLHDFTQAQKDLLAQAERTLEEYRVKLEQVYLVREELKSHIENLPDIASLPSVTGVTSELPSACDLFS